MGLPERPRSVVTGGGGGLGRAFCLELARRGGRVVVADLRLGAAEETVRMMREVAPLRRSASGPDAMAVAIECDVAKIDDVEALAVEADRRFGGTDLVVNNAGVAVAGAVGDVPLEDWRWIVDINLWGVVYGCHAFVPRFRKQGSGNIINVASAAGLLSAPEMGPYNVTKAGVIALSETLYGELSRLGINVTVLCPTFFKTDIGKNARATDDAMRSLVEKLMARAKITADGVARVALEAVDTGRLYAIPQADGRWMWRAKRLDPARFYGQGMRLVDMAIRRARRDRRATS